MQGHGESQKSARWEKDLSRTFPLGGGVAVITGAASGIGASLAANLAGRGTNLALVDRDAAGLARVAQAGRAAGVTVSEHVLDVADAEALALLPEAVLAAHGRVTVLVNNAGVAMGGTFDQATLDDFTWLFDINFWAIVRLTKAFMYALRQEPAAHIVNLSSLFGLVAPPGQVAYCASKFAVRGFSEALRHELEGSSVSLTVVHPGGVRTAIAVNARVPQGIDPEEARGAAKNFEKLLRSTPDYAADQIAQAIIRRRARLLIGGDARMVDRIQRLLPSAYWKVIGRGANNVASGIQRHAETVQTKVSAHG
jgi:short-subunit dehydrogenase